MRRCLFAGSGMRRWNLRPRSSAKRYEKCVFSSTVGLVRPKTRDKWLKVSQ